VVEFSSPNIAKPFHAGHLRSTILGNFLRNLFAKLGAKTQAINYLGDWGTQFGLLAVGFAKFGDESLLAVNPIRHLFNVYVQVNKASESDPRVLEEARDFFVRMEQGDDTALALWRRFRDLSVAEYRKVYKRLNIEFDAYDGESLQSQGMAQALRVLKEKDLLSVDPTGAIVVNLKVPTHQQL